MANLFLVVVLDVLSCKYFQECTIPKCVCLANGLKWIYDYKTENWVSDSEEEDETGLEMVGNFEEYWN